MSSRLVREHLRRLTTTAKQSGSKRTKTREAYQADLDDFVQDQMRDLTSVNTSLLTKKKKKGGKNRSKLLKRIKKKTT